MLLLLQVLVHVNETFNQLTRTSASWQLQFLEGDGQQHAPYGDNEQEALGVDEKQNIADGDGKQKILDVDCEWKIPDGNSQLMCGRDHGQPPSPISTKKGKHVHWVHFQAISANFLNFF